MGSGGTQTHILYETSPTAVKPELEDDSAGELSEAAAAASEPIEGEPEDGIDGATSAPVEAVDEFHAILEEIHALAEGPEALAAGKPEGIDADVYWYSQLKSLSAAATQKLFAAHHAGLSMEEANELDKAKAQATSQALAALDQGQLEKLASEEGFQFPELVGLNHTSGHPHALAHWLDPHYLDEAPSKQKIQAKARERFLTLCAGGEVPGKTLADVNHQQYVSAYADTTWSLSQKQFDALYQGTSEKIEAFGNLPVQDQGAALAEIFDMSNKLSSAHVSSASALDASNSVAKADIAGSVNDIFLQYHPNDIKLKDAVNLAVQQGLIPADKAQVLTRRSALYLAGASTPSDEKEAIEQTATQRLGQLQQLMEAKSALYGSKGITGFDEAGGLVTQKENLTGAEVADLVTSAKNYYGSVAEVKKWMWATSGASEIAKQAEINHIGGNYTTAEELEKSFKKWAVGQDKSALQEAAVQLGMEGAETATKTQLKKFLPTVWTDPSKASPKTATAPPAPPPAPAPSSDPWAYLDTVAVSKPAPSGAPSTATATTQTGFLGKHSALVASLAHYNAVASEVPKPLDPKVVAAHDFGAGTTASNLGGVHTKSLHTGPDGQQWLFKPDKKAGGAVAQAEAVASLVYRSAGIPAVPVYTAKVGSHQGVVQPLVKGAQPLTHDTASWSQTDVDAVMRTHVARWVLSDHDGHPNNVLRTPSGGLLPCDAGQSFKHFGKDKLSLGFHPNKAYGSPLPAHHLAYQAFLSGSLGEGVKIKPQVVHPVIKKIEAIPDSQWRAMLHSTAYQGAGRSEVSWVPTMRERAAKKHGISTEKVTKEQIAEAFLDHACERKNSLREDFASFFEKDLKLKDAAEVLRNGK
ncbi:hypothetical protein MRI28_17145 [Nocardiopsis dassonvillei]|uniref:hypothetical protein n=1 Tax=Nocardiopsis dassonvillei TaxID=2014 RepID=UPI00200D2409|nr:hypothetical protein [Nocardiopsis dassonvillei]MCK9871342.1 hypothetical protein [Nocardiopsis dassonvillei]